MAAHAAAAESKVWRLEAESELRFEVGADTTLTVALRSGSIELLGIELATNREYSFTADKLALFTWHGATLETRGETLSIYESKRDSAMISYVNTHAIPNPDQDPSSKGLSPDTQRSIKRNATSEIDAHFADAGCFLFSRTSLFGLPAKMR